MRLKNICLLLLAAWLGAAVLFSVVVAPAAFSVLRMYQLPNSSEIAGAIVSRSLAAINLSGFCIGVLLLVMLFLRRKSGIRWELLLQFITIGVATLMCAIGEWVIAARMRALRGTMILPIDRLAQEDPGRIAFSELHRYSVMVLAVAMIAALIGSLLLARET
jgi:Domain of unknown function (DUF4149)